MRLGGALYLLAGACAWGQARPDLSSLPLEELMQLEVTSAARKPQPLARTAAAVTVITREEIRRSGLTSVPEVLRLAPGVQVARLDASRWAISVRGFNGLMSNKLLVLVDGRSVYTSLYAGVYWDVQDWPLEDIERIEVIRGPGGVMWGANAVNGVINIITRHAADTQGGLLSAAAGDQDQGVGTVRYGARLGSGVHARVWSRVANRGQLLLPDASGAGDAWRLSRGGVRLDWDSGHGQALLVAADLYSTRRGDFTVLPTLAPPYGIPDFDPTRDAGGSLLGRWSTVTQRAESTVEFSFSRLRHREARLRADMHALELTFQQRLRRGAHELLWGGEFRRASDDIRNSPQAVLNPAAYADPLVAVFLQDDWSLADNRLVLTGGTKLEHSSYTGIEVEPALRLLWGPNERHSFWAAVSRAVRTPARVDRDIWHLAAVTPGNPPTQMVMRGNPEFQAEELLAWEAGYRAEWGGRVTADFAGFYNSYHHLRSLDFGAMSWQASPPHLVASMQVGNRLRGAAFGVELTTKWQVLPRWRVDTDYSWLNLRLDATSPPSPMDLVAQGGSSPKHQADVQSYLELSRSWQLDTGLYYVGSLAGLQVPAYLRADARLGWRPSARLEISVAGQNLLDNRHPEYWGVYEGISRRLEVGRSAYLQFTWRFP